MFIVEDCTVTNRCNVVSLRVVSLPHHLIFISNQINICIYKIEYLHPIFSTLNMITLNILKKEFIPHPQIFIKQIFRNKRKKKYTSKCYKIMTCACACFATIIVISVLLYPQFSKYDTDYMFLYPFYKKINDCVSLFT